MPPRETESGAVGDAKAKECMHAYECIMPLAWLRVYLTLREKVQDGGTVCFNLWDLSPHDCPGRHHPPLVGSRR
jgi:hypothetical protein